MAGGILFLIWLLLLILHYFIFGFSYRTLLYHSRDSELRFLSFWRKVTSNKLWETVYKIIVAVLWVVIISMPKYIIDMILKEPTIVQWGEHRNLFLLLYLLLLVFGYFTITRWVFKKNKEAYDKMQDSDRNG